MKNEPNKTYKIDFSDLVKEWGILEKDILDKPKKDKQLMYKRLTQWANSIPWKPKDVRVKVTEDCTGFTPSKGYTGFKKCETLDILNRYVDGAKFFYIWLKEREK